MRRKLTALAVCSILSACGLPADVIVLLPDEPGTVGKVTVARDGSDAELAEPYAAFDGTPVPRASRTFTADRRAVEAEFAGALASAPRAPVVHIIFFVIGQEEVDEASRETLITATTMARETEFADITVVGHSDAIGDDLENMALSLRRANAVRTMLVDRGVKASMIETAHHGSNNPLVPTPRGVPEPRNRRVEVVIR